MTETANDLPILNESWLKRQSMNDPDLEVEILSLFINEAERLIRQIEETDSTAKRLERFHAIRGLASNIGAEKLAKIAATRQNGDGDDVKEIKTAVNNVIAYITTTDGKVQTL